MTEDQLEQEALGWLSDVGYTLLSGYAIAVDGATPERADYKNTLLPYRLREAINRLNPSIPANTVTEFIQYAKKRNDLNFSSAGNGTISHLSGELFKQVTGVNMMHIPYKSSGAGLTALLANETQVSFLSPVTAAAQLKTGKLKALVVSTSDRFPGLPEIPGSSEVGLAGLDAKLWFGLFLPAKTPKTLIQKLNQDVSEILRRQDVKELFLKQGIQAAPSSPEFLDDFVKIEIKRWTPIIKNANIQAD